MAIAIDSRQARRPGFMPPAALARIGQRARAFRAAKRHSLLVRLLRVLLPLAVIGTLGGYVAVVTITSTLLPKIKMDDVAITADDLTMKNPSYFDITSDGRYEVRARRAIVSFGQKKDTPVKLIDVSGELVKKSGEITTLKAKNGLFDNAKGELELFDGIEIDGSNGVMARLTRARIYTKEGKVVSTDPVSANMPAGSVQAASMTMGTKTKLVQFRGGVNVRLVPQQGQALAAGKDARQPVDIRAEELDVDDAAKTAHFRGEVVAIQGETMLQTPSLLINYEGKAAAALAAEGEGAKTAKAKEGGTRVTFLRAREGVEITAGQDRRITSDLADFDVAAETALFQGRVVAMQEKNILEGGRLSIDRKAGKTRLETPGGGRILATFVPPAGTAPRPAKRPNPVETAQASLMGGFKADRSVPMTVEADLLELIDTAGKAVFTGNVSARQGEMLLRTSQLTAFYSGKGGLGLTDAGDSPARRQRQGAGEDRDRAHGGQAVGDRQLREAERHRQVGRLRREGQHGAARRRRHDGQDGPAPYGPDEGAEAGRGGGRASAAGPHDRRLSGRVGADHRRRGPWRRQTGAGDGKAKGPVTSPTTGCEPGRICGVFYPNQIKQKAIDALKKKAPKADGN